MNLENLLKYIADGTLCYHTNQKSDEQIQNIHESENTQISGQLDRLKLEIAEEFLSHNLPVPKILSETELIQLFQKISELIMYNKETSLFYKDYIYITSVTSVCIRAILFSYFNFKSKIHNQYPYTALITATGNFLHYLLQHLLKFDEVEREIQSNNLKVKGRIDAINHTSKGLNVIEIKTIKADEIKSMSFMGKREHYRQLKFYMYLLSQELNEKVHIGQLLYISRNLDKVRVFTIDDINYNNDADIQYCISKCNYIFECIEKEFIPDLNNEFIITNYCNFCMYRDICKLFMSGVYVDDLRNPNYKEDVLIML